MLSHRLAAGRLICARPEEGLQSVLRWKRAGGRDWTVVRMVRARCLTISYKGAVPDLSRVWGEHLSHAGYQQNRDKHTSPGNLMAHPPV